jgi:3-isopropylmalate/(R)-2-methylmalate dehydratase small subunit
MEPFSTLTAVAAPLVRANVDTDAIIPSREIRSVSKTGLADGLFAGWRYRQVGGREPDPAFVLNQPAYAGAKILLGGENFGCGSSREHAAWALAEYGFRAIVAPSFNPIFFGNCVRNGIVPAVVPLAAIEGLAAEVEPDPQARRLTVSLENMTIGAPSGEQLSFSLGEEQREMLRYGLDAIDLTLRWRDEIEAFRKADRARRPWIYLNRAEEAA